MAFAIIYGGLHIIINPEDQVIIFLVLMLESSLTAALILVKTDHPSAGAHISILSISIVVFTTLFMFDNFSIQLTILVLPILLAGMLESVLITAIFTSMIICLTILLYIPLGRIDANETLVYTTLFAATNGLIYFYQIYRNHLEKSQMNSLKSLINTTIFILGHTAELRDEDTGQHLERVALIIRRLAEEAAKSPEFKKYINPSYISDLIKAATLHDIGKVAIPDNILLKPGPLTDQEFEIMKTHTIQGAEIIQLAKDQLKGPSIFDLAITIARHHHEKWDGNGYPDKIKRTEIPLGARLMAVVDVYDALRSQRPYKAPFPHEKCVEIIKGSSGIHFDPWLVKCFMNIEYQLNHDLANMYSSENQ